MNRSRFFQHPAVACEFPARADQPHRRPERRLRAGDDRNAMPRLERLGHPKRTETAAGDQQALGLARLLAHPRTEVEDVLLAHAARSTELGDAEAVDGAYCESLVGEEILEPSVDLTVISGRNGNLFRADRAQP